MSWPGHECGVGIYGHRPRRPARSSARGLVQRQAHDAGVAAVDVHDPGRERTLDRVGAGLAEGLAAGDVGLDDRGRQRGEAHMRDLQRARRAPAVVHAPRRVSTRWVRPDSACSVARASSASAGLPRMRRPSATVVSAQRIGAAGGAAAHADAGAQRASLARVTRCT